MSHWKLYESNMTAAKLSRNIAIDFANRKDWTRAFANAAAAKTAQAKADEYFECYLDGLALDHALYTTRDADPTDNATCENCGRLAKYDSDLILCNTCQLVANDPSPDMGISLGDLARDAKDPHDIRS